MPEEDLKLKLEKARKRVASLEDSFQEYKECYEEEKKWHDEQYRLKDKEANALQRYLELSLELAEAKKSIEDSRRAREQLDEVYRKKGYSND